MKSFAATSTTMAMLTIAGSLLVLMVSIRNVESCSCMPRHPQQHYCDSQFVILARIKRVAVTDHWKIYKIRIRRHYKLSEKAAVALDSGRLMTPRYDSMCGVDLKPGGLYVISGRIVSLKAQTDLCNYVEEWKKLSNRQRKGLKRMYHHGCHCTIDTCFSGRCERTRNECMWNKPFEKTGDCLYKYGFCLRSSHKNCVWVKNSALSTCMRNSSLSMSELL